MDCDICGKPAVALAYVEGAQVNVCNNCVSLGRRAVEKPSEYSEKPMLEFTAVDNYAQILKDAMKKRNITSSELANKLNIHEAIIKQTESGARFPGEKIAKILEKEFSITLIKKSESKPELYPSVTMREFPNSKSSFTLGDVVTIKQKKNN